MLGRGLLAALMVFLLDQGSKAYMLALLGGKENGIEITSFFNLVIVWNTGISFGMMRGMEYGHYIFSALALAIAAALLGMLRKTSRALPAMAIGLIVGGAAGNILDRIRFGAVLDFLDFHIALHHWPAFNAADAAVFCGAVLFCLDVMLTKRQQVE